MVGCARTSRTRLADSLETCLKLAEGLAIAEFADKAAAGSRDLGRAVRANKSLERNAMSACCFRRNSQCPVLGLHSFPRSSRGCSPSTIRYGALPVPATGPGHPARRSTTRLIVPGAEPHACGAGRRLRRLWAKSSSPYYTQTSEGAGQAIMGFNLSGPLGRSSGQGRSESRSCAAPRRRSAFKYDDGLRSYTTSEGHSRASSPYL